MGIYTSGSINMVVVEGGGGGERKKIIQKGGEEEGLYITPFKSFLPLAGKILTYLEAIRKPRKHMVKTFAMGKTAILMVPSSDSPPR